MISARVAGVPRPRLLHRLAQLLVVDQLAGGLHRGEQRRLGVARRRLRHLGLALGGQAADGLALLELRQLAAVRSPRPPLLLGLGLEPVDAAPARLERDLAARAEALALDLGDDGRARVARRRMEDGEEAAGDEVEDAALVRRGASTSCGMSVGMIGVVVADLRVVDDALQRQLVEAHHVACAASRYSPMSCSVEATIFSCGTMSPDRYAGRVRGYVITFLPSYSACAAWSVRRALKPYLRFASRCREVRS